MKALWLPFAVGLASFAGTRLLVASRIRLAVDVPNERSSHSRPTRRGGGLAVAATVLVGIALAAVLHLVPLRPALALVIGGLAVAGVGLADDLTTVSAGVRIVVHLAAASFAVLLIGGMPSLTLGESRVALGWGGHALGVLGIAWMTNLFNFMDGIDGLAGGEGVLGGAVASGLLLWSGHNELAIASLIVAAGCAGFVPSNWEPARIFMGDVGSGFVGFLFGALAVMSERSNALPAALWVLIFGAFVFDATVTLARRIARREPFAYAHRRHAYQRLLFETPRHSTATLRILGVTGILAVLAALGYMVPQLFWPALGAGLGTLTLLYLRVERRRPMWQ